MGGWSELVDELDAWDAAGLIATLWWRDDDVVAPSRQLDTLFQVAASVPIALASIAGRTTSALAERLDGCQRTIVLHHGWLHKNHGSSTMRTEYPASRSAGQVVKELQQGYERMATLFGETFHPVFAPPWHRFDDKLLPLLLKSGHWSISRLGARSGAAKAAGIFEANVQVDLLQWQHPPAFIGLARAIGQLLNHLRGRRLGRCDLDEPTGILTHHMKQDAAAYEFIEQLVALTIARKAVRWLRASEIFPATQFTIGRLRPHLAQKHTG